MSRRATTILEEEIMMKAGEESRGSSLDRREQNSGLV